MLNWFVWNGTVFEIETELTLNCFFFKLELFWYLTQCRQNLYLYKTEMVELELFDETE